MSSAEGQQNGCTTADDTSNTVR